MAGALALHSEILNESYCHSLVLHDHDDITIDDVYLCHLVIVLVLLKHFSFALHLKMATCLVTECDLYNPHTYTHTHTQNA